MIFWRKNKNAGEQEQQDKEDKIVHPSGEPGIEPPTEYDAEMDSEFVHHELEENENEIIDELDVTPTPKHTPLGDAEEREDLRDHSDEGGWLSRMTRGLSKSTGKLGQGIADILTKKKLDQNALDDLEDILITADLGPGVARQLVQDLSDKRFGSDISDEEIRIAMAETVEDILAPVAQPLNTNKPDNGPLVLLICGVNGAGKTTTIGKLAHEWAMREHRKVMIAAADTFRAAAIDQLEVWAKRAHVPLFKKDIGADAASVAFEAYEKAKADGADILMIDTAGRLQNKVGLMEELQKIVRVLKKQNENIPHATLLVLDATTGQNAHSQVKIFGEAVNVTGLIVTKLDGSAKGGVVVSLAREFGLPIHAIGVGETAEDLSPFRARDFARALMGLSS